MGGRAAHRCPPGRRRASWCGRRRWRRGGGGASGPSCACASSPSPARSAPCGSARPRTCTECNTETLA
eukprot:scaffold3725_cov376-Prasinococcus_capsulatus_cf.AAC.4